MGGGGEAKEGLFKANTVNKEPNRKRTICRAQEKQSPVGTTPTHRDPPRSTSDRDDKARSADRAVPSRTEVDTARSAARRARRDAEPWRSVERTRQESRDVK